MDTYRTECSAIVGRHTPGISRETMGARDCYRSISDCRAYVHETAVSKSDHVATAASHGGEWSQVDLHHTMEEEVHSRNTFTGLIGSGTAATGGVCWGPWSFHLTLRLAGWGDIVLAWMNDRLRDPHSHSWSGYGRPHFQTWKCLGIHVLTNAFLNREKKGAISRCKETLIDCTLASVIVLVTVLRHTLQKWSIFKYKTSKYLLVLRDTVIHCVF